MPPLHTLQASYEKMRKKADPASDEATITDFKPSARVNADNSLGWYEVDPAFNGIEMIPYQADNTADINGTWQLWGMARQNGPAELLAEISGTVGTAKISDDFTALAYDTLTVDSDVHIADISVSDAGGNDRVAKIRTDAVGYQFLKNVYTDISAANNCLIRGY
jgi:hypothetical protein